MKKQNVPIRSDSVVAFICRRHRGQWQTLLLKRRKRSGGFWQQVSGGIHRGEAAWQAAVREIREETALEVERLYSCDRLELFYDAQEEVLNVSPAFVAFVRGDEDIRLCDEHERHQWVSFAQAHKMLPFTQQREMARFVRDDFLRRSPNEHLRIHL